MPRGILIAGRGSTEGQIQQAHRTRADSPDSGLILSESETGSSGGRARSPGAEQPAGKPYVIYKLHRYSEYWKTNQHSVVSLQMCQ